MRDRLVIAIGNPLRGDDGAGAALAAGLSGPRLRVVVVPQLVPELADEVAAAAAVAFVDAAVGPPGRVRVARPARSGAARLGHALGPHHLLALADRLHRRAVPAVLVTVGGASFGLGAGLSAAVVAALPRGRARLLRALDALAPARAVNGAPDRAARRRRPTARSSARRRPRRGGARPSAAPGAP